MSITRTEARELMSRGYEMGATVLNGPLRRDADGNWMVGDRPLEEVLDELQGDEVLLVASVVGESGGPKRVCRVCGTEYVGHECPRCRQVRQRLRGRW
jgi:hypothetical protein